MAQMIALRPFRYAGKLLAPGTRFDVLRKVDVQILSILGRAKKLIPDPPEKPSQKISETPEEPEKIEALMQKRKGRYRRRDMKAEDA